MREDEITAVAQSDAYGAIGVPTRDGKHYLTEKDQ